MKRDLVALAVVAFAALSACRDADDVQRKEHEHEPPAVQVEAGVVTLDEAARERLGVEVRALETRKSPREVVAYGELTADPGRTWALRAPVAGTVRAEGDAWPKLGQTLDEGARVGALAPRLSAGERIDLASRLESARGDETAARAELAGAQHELERVRALNADGKNASDRALQESEAHVAGVAARIESARALQSVLAAALDGRSESLAGLPLALERGGEVISVDARPGEAVEAGAAIVQVARFDELLAEIELPLGAAVEPAGLRIVALAHADHPLDGEFVARAANTDAASRGVRWIVRVRPGDLALRPGEAVTAYVRVAGEPVEGAIVPRSAIVRFAGGTWAYAQVDEHSFARRELVLDQAREDGWFTSAPWTHGASVAVVGAQALLSTEILSASAPTDEEE